MADDSSTGKNDNELYAALSARSGLPGWIRVARTLTLVLGSGFFLLTSCVGSYVAGVRYIPEWNAWHADAGAPPPGDFEVLVRGSSQRVPVVPMALEQVARLDDTTRREVLDVTGAPRQFGVYREIENSGEVEFEIQESGAGARLIEFDWRYDGRWGISRYEVRGAHVRPLYDAIWTPSILFVAMFFSLATTLTLAATGRVLKFTWKNGLQRISRREESD